MTQLRMWVIGLKVPLGLAVCFEDECDAIEPTSTKLVRDEYNVGSNDIFVMSSMINDDPNTWEWEQESSTPDADIHNGFYHLGIDGSNQEWAIVGSDR